MSGCGYLSDGLLAGLVGLLVGTGFLALGLVITFPAARRRAWGAWMVRNTRTPPIAGILRLNPVLATAIGIFYAAAGVGALFFGLVFAVACS